MTGGLSRSEAPARSASGLSGFGWAALLAFGAALLALPVTGHVDDSDADVYRVVVRNMVADHAWLDLRYLPRVHPHFHEHLPFGFWPFAAAVRVFGEASIPVVGGLFTLLLLALVAWLAQRLSGGLAAVVAFVVLVTTESIFVLGATARLDALLMLLTTLSVVPLLAPEVPLTLGIAAAALATLVKGPFGLLPFACVSVALAVVHRSWTPLLRGIAGTVLAALPVAAFLALEPAWWDGYGKAQLLASALGSRPDGMTVFWAPLYFIAGRFWPGLPLLLIGFALARSRDDKLIAFSSGLMIICLMLPQRKVWNHSLVAFPLLAVLSGMAIQKLARFQIRTVERCLAAVSVVVLLALALRAGRWLWKPRCVAAGPLHDQLARLPEGTEIAVVSDAPSWLTIGSLAAELHLTPAPVRTLSDDFAWAIASDTPVAPTWRTVDSGSGWTVLSRASR
jgi:4-amino-4-deoxy-L-arabinose transferase-like glycosyltransferase